MSTTSTSDVSTEIRQIAERTKKAAREVARLDTGRKNRALGRIAEALIADQDAIIQANAEDLAEGAKRGLSEAMLDRLRLDAARIAGIAASVREVQALPDPVGEVTGMARRPNDLLVGRVRIPLGVVSMIYESRPNVTVDAAVLCLKSGNACILRGGSEAHRSNMALARTVKAALEAEGLPTDAVSVVPFTDREGILELIKLEGLVDLVIPRGGEGLIRFVAEHARVPVIKHYKGVCHMFVDSSADLTMARELVVNAKTSRPGVCNALETLLVHRDVAGDFLPALAAAMPDVELRGGDDVRSIVGRAVAASESDWDEEYLALILAVRIVDDLDAAMDHIAAHGSLHTEVIVTSDYAHSQRFLREVDASCVMVNASTRFNDGGELGLGTEVGISTTKLHAFGPMGLAELTTQKFVVYGNGQARP